MGTTNSLSAKSVNNACEASVGRCSQSYMGPTASSRAKMSRSSSVEGMNVSASQDTSLGKETPLNAPSSSVDLSVEQCKENMLPTSHPVPALATSAMGNHSARASLRLDLNAPERASLSPVSFKSRLGKVEQTETPRRQALVTPTEMRSLGKECRQQISNIEKSLTPKNTNRLSVELEMFAGNPTESEFNKDGNSGLCENESRQISETDMKRKTSTEMKNVQENSGIVESVLNI